ncbi:MAG: PAS domain S-box protein [Cyanobacteria bacterium REEB67]|nr:PAS domain S-box protein [Cyanobacteria bacterium REEB67]
MEDVFSLNQAPFGILRTDKDLTVLELNTTATVLDPRLDLQANLGLLYEELRSPLFGDWRLANAGALTVELKLPDSGCLLAQIWAGEEDCYGFVLSRKSEAFPLDKRRALLAEAAEQAWESICITDAELDAPGPRFVYANQGYQKLMGWSEAEILGKNPRIHQGPLTDRNVLDRLRSDLENGRAFHGETINYRKDGEAFWLEWKISPVKNAEGKIVNFIAFQRDVSAVKVAQQRIKDFHSVLAHELRAPLTSILGSLRLIHGFYPPENVQAKEFLEIAMFSTERLTALINDLLELSKIESSQVELNLSTVAVQELADLAAKSLISYRVDDRVAIEVCASAAFVKADKERIIQVLINLISNAMKFSPANESVLISTESRPGGVVRFSVTDRGPGISESNQLKLFTKFQQIASEDGVHRQGTGLGLSIAKALIEQHKGKIGVNSEIGKGSTFWFELEEVEEVQTLASAQETAKILLLVEDDKRLSKLIKFHLGTEGFQVHSVSTVAAAIETLKTLKPHACIVDMFLPDGTGLSLIEHIKGKYQDNEIPVLMTTASRSNETALNSSLAINWLFKPFELGQLASQIKEMLSNNCQRLVVCENSQAYWDALPNLFDPQEFALVDCSDEQSMTGMERVSATSGVIVKFDGSQLAESNLKRITDKLTGTKTIIVCSRGKMSMEMTRALNGLIGELISGERLSEEQFVRRLRGTL